MYPEAYDVWINIFNEDLAEIWQKERQELKKVSVLLSALQKEFLNVQTNVEIELHSIQQQLEYKDLLFEKKNLSHNKLKKKSSSPLDKENNVLVKKICEPESPDIFEHSDPNVTRLSSDISVIDIISDENVLKADVSPTIRRRKRYKKCKIEYPFFSYKNNTKDISIDLTTSQPLITTTKTPKEDSVKINLFKTPRKSVPDTSIIENTPKSKRPKTVSKFGVSSSKKKFKTAMSNSTLTQLYTKENLRPSVTNADDADSDETFFEDQISEEKMGITHIIDYINADDTKDVKDELRSNDDLRKYKLVPIEPEPIVRGKARKQLNGWTCEQCKDFYGHMNLSPEELKKRLDECSKHRYKYRPVEDTLPGFWDLSIPPEESLERKQLHS